MISVDALTQKEVPQQDSSQDHKYQRYLYILRSLHSGLRPSQIVSQLGIPKTTFQHYLNDLKCHGLISKIGYGVWELSDKGISSLKRSTMISHVANQQDPKEVPITSQQNLSFFFAKPDSVRAHAFVFTVNVPPHLRNWNNKIRAKYLTHHNISFTELNIGGGGQRIIHKGKKVWLMNRSVVIYDRSSYLAESSNEAKSYAISKLISLIKSLERLLHADFTERAGRQYTFKVSRQHYALIKNALAKQYDAEGKKLNIYSDKGLWFVIDNSFDLHEAETVHPETADADSTKVQNWFNGLKKYPMDPEFILHALNDIIQSQQNNQQIQSVFSKNMSSHIQVIQDLGSGVNELTKLMKVLQSTVQLSKGQRTLECLEEK